LAYSISSEPSLTRIFTALRAVVAARLQILRDRLLAYNLRTQSRARVGSLFSLEWIVGRTHRDEARAIQTHKDRRKETKKVEKQSGPFYPF
jgi:hypothetical protein